MHNDQLESLLHPNNLNTSCSIKKTPYSNNSLQVDSAASMSGVSQQSTPPTLASPVMSQTTPPTTSVGELGDDAQKVDLVSSFLFPISFIIFNIIYWMVYLNMQVESNN